MSEVVTKSALFSYKKGVGPLQKLPKTLDEIGVKLLKLLEVNRYQFCR